MVTCQAKADGTCPSASYCASDNNFSLEDEEVKDSNKHGQKEQTKQ